MSRTVSIRNSLLRNFILVIALLSGSILAATFFWADQAVETLSRSLIRQTIEQIELQLDRFFDPVRSLLETTRAWNESGILESLEPEALNPLFVPALRRHRQVSAVLIADARGREYMLLRAGGRWSVRRTQRDEWGDRTRWLEWNDDGGEIVRSEKELDYDPRDRPWFQGALSRAADAASGTDPGAAVHWTRPYLFYTVQRPGITAAVAVDREDRLQRVVGLDVLLSDISAFTTGLRVSEHGAVFVLTDDEERVIGLPRNPRFEDPAGRAEALLRHPDELDVPAMADGNRAYAGRTGRLEEPFRFRSGGQPWWGGVRPYPLSPNRSLRIFVVVPESDLLGRLAQMRLWILGLTLVVLAVSVLRAVAVARTYSRPIEDLVQESHRIARGDLEAERRIDSKISEVRQLAEAHERMRIGLRSLLKLERDLQVARQIQQDTFPRQLPELRGYRMEAWSEPAEETGGDSYDVVGLKNDPGPGQEIVAGGRADRCLLLLADATGHGIGPALSVTQVRAMLRMAVRTGESLASIVRHMNAQLSIDLDSGRFVTMWIGELDARAGTLRTFSAGQAPLLFYRAATGVAELRDAEAPPLGILPDLECGDCLPIHLEPGDIYAVLSDGIYEAHSPEGATFGGERVQEVVVAHRHESPDAILRAIREAVAAFTQGRPAEDDRTAIILKRDPA